MEYTLVKTKRRTISVEVRDSGVIVRAPKRTSRREADAFVKKHENWIEKQLEKRRIQNEQLSRVEKLSERELVELYERARAYLPERARYYAGLLGEDFGRVTIRCQKTRWGSCSIKRNLNFNCLLMLTPPEVIDSVVVHEVCHLREMNHSKRFYELVLRLIPDYRTYDKWLKENGKALLARIPDDPAAKESGDRS